MRTFAVNCLLASCALLLCTACSSTDPFHVYRAPNGTVLLSHEAFADSQVSAHQLERLDWEEFNRAPEYVYVWEQGDLPASLVAEKGLSGGEIPVFSGEP